jgi:hypothetical protein
MNGCGRRQCQTLSDKLVRTYSLSEILFSLSFSFFHKQIVLQIVISMMKYLAQIKTWRYETKYEIICTVDDDFDVIFLIECKK